MDNNSYVEEDTRSNSEFLADLNDEFHDRALFANQKSFYKRSRRVGSAKKPMDKSNETFFACGKLGKYKGLKAEIDIITKKIDAMSKGKSEKGLVAESFDWDEKSVSSDDEGVTRVKAFMAIAEDEPSVGKTDQGPARPVVIREPESRRLQPLLEINPGDQDEGQAGPNLSNQDEGQAGPNPGDQDEGQAGSNPGDATESQPQSSHVGILEEPASSSGTMSSLQNLEKDLSFTDQFFVEKPQEEEPGKTNAEAEVQSMISVPIHQDTSSVPPMTTPVIDLTNTSDPIFEKRIGELEQHMTDLIQNSLAREERLDKQRTQLYNLENLNIPHKVNQAVDEIVTDAIDWKSLELDYPNQRLAYQEEARKKRRQRRDVPRTPSGSPHSQPPPPPPPAGASGAPSTSGASGYESFGVSRAQELSLTDSLMQDDSIPDEQVHLSDDEDSGNDHLPKADSRKDWWKPLPEEERPATPEPSWIIPSSNVSAIENN
ncbi:hypothetical protein Tco_1210818 [Tanacetum coccineum]